PSLGRHEDLIRIDAIDYVYLEETDELNTKHSIYIPKAVCDEDRLGVPYLLNWTYTVKKGIREWTNIPSLYVMKNTNINEEEVNRALLMDEEGDAVFWNESKADEEYIAIGIIKKGVGALMIIAKKRPNVETLSEHTNQLLERFSVLKQAYFEKIPDENVWDLLYKAALYHDLGKVNNDFQQKVHQAIKSDQKFERSKFGHIPHNYLSPFFLPVDHWDLSKEERKVLIQAIAYHHERDTQPDINLLREVYETELIHHFPKL